MSTSSKRRHTFATVLITSIILVALIAGTRYFIGESVPPSPKLSPSHVVTGPDAPEGQEDTGVRTPVATEPSRLSSFDGASAGDTLGSYPDGDRIAARLEAAGVDLASLPPLTQTEAEARIELEKELLITDSNRASLRRGFLTWPEYGQTLDLEWVHSNVGVAASGITDEQLLLLTAELLPVQAELEYAVEDCLVQLEQVVANEIALGAYEMYPYMRPTDPNDSSDKWKEKGGAFYSDGSTLKSGWNGGFVLYREDYPAASAAVDQVYGMRRVRKKIASSRLAEWGFE